MFQPVNFLTCMVHCPTLPPPPPNTHLQSELTSAPITGHVVMDDFRFWGLKVWSPERSIRTHHVHCFANAPERFFVCLLLSYGNRLTNSAAVFGTLLVRPCSHAAKGTPP